MKLHIFKAITIGKKLTGIAALLLFSLIITGCTSDASYANTTPDTVDEYTNTVINTPDTDPVPPDTVQTEATTITEKPATSVHNNIPAEPSPEQVCLDVKNIMQMPLLPNGCEITSLAIVLNYMGYDIDHYTLYSDYLPRSPYQEGNPWIEYIGEATDYGYGCYAPCIEDAGNTYLSMLESEYRVKDVSYQRLEDYKKYIDEGKPVILWGMIDMLYDPTIAWWTYVDGEEVVWYTNSHCLVMIGYTEDEYIFCDPLVGIAYYNKYAVLDCFRATYTQACIIE